MRYAVVMLPEFNASILLSLVSRRASRTSAAAVLFLCTLLSVPSAAATIFLDTGHTDAQPGAISPGGRREHDYNSRFVRELKSMLAARGHVIIDVAALGMDTALASRTTGTDRADVFVSIHHDSISQEWIDAGHARRYAGFSVLVSAKNVFADRSLACARGVGRAMAAVGEHPSLYHATPIKGENRPLLDRSAGVHQYDDLVVLKTARSPAVLVEIGVISNPDEELRLAQPGFIRVAAEAVAIGLDACIASKAADRFPR